MYSHIHARTHTHTHTHIIMTNLNVLDLVHQHTLQPVLQPVSFIFAQTVGIYGK